MILLFIMTFLTCLFAIFAIRAREQKLRIQFYFFKPLTMFIILWMATVVAQPKYSHYFWFIMGGLIFCLAGDILLMLPSDRFIAGLISFLAGHIFYILAFTSGKGFTFSLEIMFPFVFLEILIYGILVRRLNKMKLPVFIYTTVIVIMAWQSWERWNVMGSIATLLAAIGAVLFLISDGLLAINRFRKEYPYAHVLILSTYYGAQCLIALSVHQ